MKRNRMLNIGQQQPITPRRPLQQPKRVAEVWADPTPAGSPFQSVQGRRTRAKACERCKGLIVEWDTGEAWCTRVVTDGGCGWREGPQAVDGIHELRCAWPEGGCGTTARIVANSGIPSGWAEIEGALLCEHHVGRSQVRVRVEGFRKLLRVMSQIRREFPIVFRVRHVQKWVQIFGNWESMTEVHVDYESETPSAADLKRVPALAGFADRSKHRMLFVGKSTEVFDAVLSEFWALAELGTLYDPTGER